MQERGQIPHDGEMKAVLFDSPTVGFRSTGLMHTFLLTI